MGKLSNKEQTSLLSCIKTSPDVIIPPKKGYDSGVHRLGDKYLVVSTDPCVNVPEDWFGWLLINYAASDVAVFGAKPEFCSINLLGPMNAKAEEFQNAMKQSCMAADDLEIAIVTGHTGTYKNILQMTGVCTAYGTITPDKLITPGNCKPGDLILCTKSLGLEIAVNFSNLYKDQASDLFGYERTDKLISQMSSQSCVKEALKLSNKKLVHAMHDITEGGLVSALNEMADASQLGFKVKYEEFPLNLETQKLLNYFRLSDQQILSASSTGTILAAVNPNKIEEAIETLNEIGVQSTIIGEFTKDRKRILSRNKKDISFPERLKDPYTKILSGKV